MLFGWLRNGPSLMLVERRCWNQELLQNRNLYIWLIRLRNLLFPFRYWYKNSDLNISISSKQENASRKMDFEIYFVSVRIRFVSQKSSGRWGWICQSFGNWLWLLKTNSYLDIFWMKKTADIRRNNFNIRDVLFWNCKNNR